MSVKRVERGIVTLRSGSVLSVDLFSPPWILKPLHAEYRAGRRYELMAPFVYVSAIPGVGQITVPKGRITDFHSVPRLLWNVLPPDDWAEAAVAHDELYLMGRSDDGPVTQALADRVHRECLIHVGAPVVRANVMYAGLRLGGFVDWQAESSRREHADAP